MADIKPDTSGGKFELPIVAPEREDKLIESIPKPEAEATKIKNAEPKKPVKKISTVSDAIINNETINPATQAIEDILAEDLKDVYSKLSKSKQIELKSKGEDTANQIATLLNQIKYKVSEILGLIKNWLKIIPGLSKFFLEQEAKIKTDKIINITKIKNKN